MLNKIAPKMETQNPPILASLTKPKLILKTIALTTNENKPKVMILIGKEIRLRIGLINILTNAKANPKAI